ncbi:hypothetical protein DICVIV_06079 [Dictyocaulus viviparus]|uniref:Carboxylesterase type B domain-containing protein n=1 Tax=Dictyocaulus viviparus TaxID=29172 RepID=A0A0D8XT96_DICVI|nr:hypothetical protein DICVIV_06079 [Dictyocaulus viviparus]
MFNDDYLVNNFAGHDIVLVIPGIRLGFFGLLTFNNENVVPSNIAAYDLIAALMFVQNEIEHFGGDHNHVTLFGHSQGATTVAQFIFSKKIDPDKKLFQKGVMMSMSFYFANKSRMQDISMEFAFRSKCSPSRRVQNISEDFTKNVVNCLQKIDSFELLRIQRQMEDEDMNLSPEGLVMTRPLFGSIDNLTSFLQKPTPRPLLIGTTSREFDSKPPRDHVEEYIVEFLGIKNKHDVLRQYHKDELLKKLRQ